MQLGIFCALQVEEGLRSRFGDYPRMFERLLRRSLNNLLTVKPYRVDQSEYPEDIDECDAYLITGSAASVLDDDPWIHDFIKFVNYLHCRQKKTIGICFGHQIMAQALGGYVDRSDQGWEVGVHEYRCEKQEPWMIPQLHRFRLICSHQDRVKILPPEAKTVISSDFCPIAGMQVGDHFLSFQGHPELAKEFVACLMHMRQHKIGKSKISHGLASLKLATNQDVIAQWITRFLNQ